MRRFILVLLVFLVVLPVGALVYALAFTAPVTPPALPTLGEAGSIIQREQVDLPQVKQFTARDGITLAYRAYPASPERVAVMIHGSSGSSAGVHGFSKALQAAGITVYAPDIRGHGQSGRKGDIDYVGQLEDDLNDLLKTIGPLPAGGKRILIGHSSGGGFALRVASSGGADQFSGYLFLAPYINHESPTARPNVAGWANASVPRIIALALLSRLGINSFGDLPVVAFAIPPEEITANRTPNYSFRLWANFAPHQDWRSDIRNIRKPSMVIVGANDELFRADQFEPLFRELRPDIPVTTIPILNHMDLVTKSNGREAAIKGFDILNAR
jgi:non-heme chloroperoxidase